MAKMWECFEKPFENDASLDPRPLPSLHMRRRCSALSSEQVPSQLLDYSICCIFAKLFASSEQWGVFLGEVSGFRIA